MKKTSRKFFVVFISCGVLMSVPDVVFAECTVSKQDCPANQYNKHTCHVVQGTTVYTGYECELCSGVSDKFTLSDGGTITVDGCHSPGKSCDERICYLYYDGSSNCTGAHLEYFVTPICVPSTWACSNFYMKATPSIVVGDVDLGQWQKSNQRGNAVWTGSGWDMAECFLQTEKNNIHMILSKVCDAGVIWRNGAVAVWNVDEGHYDIKYSGSSTEYYCNRCATGRYPVILSRNEASSYNCARIENDSSHLACYCEDIVTGCRSGGCTIEYPLQNNDIPQGCACVPDNTEYCDGIGCFTLGTSVCN